MIDPKQQQFYRRLGARIRELRGNKLSQEELAKLVNLKRTSIVNIEAGEQKLLVHNLIAIAKALGVHSKVILDGFEADEPPGTFSISSEGEDTVNVAVGQWVQRAISKAIRPSSQP